MFGSRKNSKPEKCSKMPQNPTRQVHALLGGVAGKTTLFNGNSFVRQIDIHLYCQLSSFVEPKLQ
jgi:hypothetical protein